MDPDSNPTRDNRSAFLTGASGFIGTNLVEALLKSGWRVTNFDTAEPLNRAHMQIYWRGDILDSTALSKAMTESQPDVVIHLAARTDCDQNTTLERGYTANTKGTRNVLDAIKRTASIKRYSSPRRNTCVVQAGFQNRPTITFPIPFTARARLLRNN